MIGVMSKAGQGPLVEEFFQLFKTPWESWRPDRAYDAVIATTDDLPATNTPLLIVYSANVTRRDARHGLVPKLRRQGGCVSYRGCSIPIYGELLTFDRQSRGTAIATADGEPAVLRVGSTRPTTLRVGYDLFEELRFLLSGGQPVDHAHVATLDLQIATLRESLQRAGVSFAEIPAAPSGYPFTVCLTHDIDFVGIRKHKFDATMWGFVYRSTLGALANVFRRRLAIRRLLAMWRAVASLPFVYLGWAKDFWNPFEWYLRVEKNLPATYFFIPFKRRAGEHVSTPHAARRAAGYDITDVPEWTSALLKHRCEIGVHGIDAWHSVDRGRQELARITTVAGESTTGVRIHWLLQHADTYRLLEKAGYAYDASAGYNETIGYRNGTSQVFRPPSARRLLELPLHIQDGALFYRHRLNLSEPDAWARCIPVIQNAQRHGGVVTLLWHDRSHGPERFWGDFYARLIEQLKSQKPWFATCRQAIGWFQRRRQVRFEEVERADGSTFLRMCYDGEEIQPPLTVRVYKGHAPRTDGHPDVEPAANYTDVPWNGRVPIVVAQRASLRAIS